MAGMSREDWLNGESTRSGLLWEVERLLNECDELPQILLMENVIQVHSKSNLDSFNYWIEFLKSKGYTSFYQDLDARNYGVAQSRKRCFMVSVLGDFNYKFPEPFPLDKVMKDYLEDDVEEKYYINNDKAKELIDKLIIGGKIDVKDSAFKTVDLTINEPNQIKTANCIKARVDAGISNFKQDGSGVVKVTKV